MVSPFSPCTLLTGSFLGGLGSQREWAESLRLGWGGREGLARGGQGASRKVARWEGWGGSVLWVRRLPGVCGEGWAGQAVLVGSVWPREWQAAGLGGEGGWAPPLMFPQPATPLPTESQPPVGPDSRATSSQRLGHLGGPTDTWLQPCGNTHPLSNPGPWLLVHHWLTSLGLVLGLPALGVPG